MPEYNCLETPKNCVHGTSDSKLSSHFLGKVSLSQSSVHAVPAGRAQGQTHAAEVQPALLPRHTLGP